MTHIDLEELRAIAGTSPHMRIGALLHMLEKRKKVEELREERDRINTPLSANVDQGHKRPLQAVVDEKSKQSFWERIMGRAR